LNAIATTERLETIARVREALAAAGAWILGHHAFSNLSFTVEFEIQPSQFPQLAVPLAAAGLHLTRSSAAQLASPPLVSHPLHASLQITFFHPEPDLRDTIPSVPG
jgi:hypothetical protein